MTETKNFKIAMTGAIAVGCTVLSAVTATASATVMPLHKLAGFALKATSWLLSGAGAIAASAALTPIVDMVDEKLSGVVGGYGVPV